MLESRAHRKAVIWRNYLFSWGLLFQFENNACDTIIIQDKYHASTNLIEAEQYFFTEDANLFQTDGK